MQAGATSYYIDNLNGNDSDNGTSVETPWQTLTTINNTVFSPGDTIYLKRSTNWDSSLVISSNGTESGPITIAPYGDGSNPVIEGLTIDECDFIFIKDLIIDKKKTGQDAVKVRGSNGSTLSGLIVRNGTLDGIDIARATNLEIKDTLIHHFLGGSFTNQVDAHGIVISKSQNVAVRNTEIHHVSGDSFHADPERNEDNLTNDLIITDCHFWTGPLTEDFNDGWIATAHLSEEQKQYPGENAIDTKVLTRGWESHPRMRITISNITAHGWKKDGYISNKAVFNMKEYIEAVFDGLTVYDSEIAFRLRGTRGNANVTIKNAVIYNCDKAIRAENDLANLKVYNSTFGENLPTQIEYTGGDAGAESWDFKNNAFVNERPSTIPAEANTIIDTQDLNTNFINCTIGDYQLSQTSQLIDSGVTIAEVSKDCAGNLRSLPYDIGAFEFQQEPEPKSPNPSFAAIFLLI